MSFSLKSSADGSSAIIQINGVDKVAIDSSGNITGDPNMVRKNVVNTFTAQQVPMGGTLTDGTTINWDGNTNGQVVAVTIGGNRTMNAPTNIQQYALYIMRVAQDATGSRTLTWNAAYKFGTSGAPTLTTTASKVDILSFIGGSGNTLEYLGIRKNAV